MKILLIGEYSGLHNNLKDGLMALGYKTILAASGDGFKAFPADILWESSNNGIIGKFDRMNKILLSLPKLRGFDVIQIINPTVFSNNLSYNHLLLKYLINNNGRSFFLAAGDDPIVWDYWKNPRTNNLKYSWIPDLIKYDLKGVSSLWESSNLIDWQSYLTKRVNGIIPIMIEYALPYRDFRSVKQTIPIPINTDKVIYKDNIVKDKLVIFHGLNRYGAKGTVYVERAFEILKKKYPNDLDLIIEGNMPYKKYFEVINKANIIIDQSSSYSLGVNGLLSMAKGKVVLGGAEPESIEELKYRSSPMINIIPSEDDIVKNVEKLLENRKKIGEIGYNSRRFIEEHHHYIKIAEKYVSTWKF